MTDERRAIHAYLTADGHDRWHTLAEEAGVSLSGLLEAFAEDFRVNPPQDGGQPRWEEIVHAARRVDAVRRRRKRS